jgi:hypothetical protein
MHDIFPTPATCRRKKKKKKKKKKKVKKTLKDACNQERVLES